jgi:hypothetical protein
VLLWCPSAIAGGCRARWAALDGTPSHYGRCLVVSVTLEGEPLLGWQRAECATGALLLCTITREMQRRGVALQCPAVAFDAVCAAACAWAY